MNIRIHKGDVVAFDLDDTLYNEIDFLKSAYFEIATHLTSNNPEWLYAHMFYLYRNKENVFLYLNQEYGITIKKLLDIYHNHLPAIHLFDGARELMMKVKEKSGYLAIITDGRSITQRNKIKQLGLSKLVDCVVVSEEINSEKPNILNFRKVEGFYKSKKYIYFADNLNKDFIAPNQLEWDSYALIDNGKNIHKSQNTLSRPKTHLPKHFIRGYSELNII